jgi:RNA polymerase sigma-70 factor, ECF subfamily
VSDSSDENLVREFVKTGSRAAFSQLYYRYKDKVFNTAYRIVGEYEGARDVAHDVFLKVYVEAPGFMFKASFSSWLYRIAVNRSLDEARRIKRRKPTFSFDALPRELPSGRDSDLPESSVIGKEAGIEFAEALAALSPKLRTVITLRYFEGLTYEQIAEVIGRPIGTVKSRLRRAHRRLGDKLNAMGFTPPEGDYGLLNMPGNDA